MGNPSRANRLHHNPEGSSCNSRTQPAVAGLAATIHAKFSGVSSKASRLAVADRLTDKAVLPPPKWVTTFDSDPPGQAATSIIAVSTFAGSGKTRVTHQVASGSSRNWGTKPIATARGARATRKKSAKRSSSATAKTINARTAPSTACWPGTR